jgi:hypothetical protein
METEIDISEEYEKRFKAECSKRGTPDKAELISALHKALVCIASEPEFWYEEALIRGLLWRCRRKKPN